MKIRTDYVSNSSSSSFVLAQNELFEFFGITKADIMDAIIEAYGRKTYENEMASVAKSIAEHPDWHEDDIEFGSFGPIWVYDLWNKDDRREAIERWGGLLKEWDANNCHYVKTNKGKDVMCGTNTISKFNSIVEGVADIMDISRWDLRELSASAKCKVSRFIRANERDPKTGIYGHYEPMPEYVGEFLRDLRTEAGIMTNLDVLKSKAARFFVHADDNQLPCGESENPDEKFDSESYTYDRMCEVLLRNLVKLGKVNPNDPKFMESLKIDNKYLSATDKKLGEIYDFLNGKFLTWKDLKAATMTWNMHEG